MAFLLTDVQMVTVDVAFADAEGNPADVEGAPVWASSDESVLTVTPSDDGFGADVSSVGPLGSAQVSVTADADLGEGTTEVIGLLDVEVVASAAVAATLTPGTPEDRA